MRWKRYKLGPGHALAKVGNTGFSYCYRCGIVVLKNERTWKILRRPCGE